MRTSYTSLFKIGDKVVDVAPYNGKTLHRKGIVRSVTFTQNSIVYGIRDDDSAFSAREDALISESEYEKDNSTPNESA